MSAYFFDTSAVLKRYVQEQGTTWVESITSNVNHVIYIAQITPIEFTSAIYRRWRENTLSQQGVDDAFLLFRRHLRQQYNVVRLTNQLVLQAQEVLLKHPLRAYDATQLTSALTLQHKLNVVLHFVSADIRLLHEAQLEGLTPINPNHYP